MTKTQLTDDQVLQQANEYAARSDLMVQRRAEEAAAAERRREDARLAFDGDFVANYSRAALDAVEVEGSPSRAFEAPSTWLDVSLAERVLGWRPATSLAEGIGRTWRSRG